MSEQKAKLPTNSKSGGTPADDAHFRTRVHNIARKSLELYEKQKSSEPIQSFGDKLKTVLKYIQVLALILLFGAAIFYGTNSEIDNAKPETIVK